MEGGEVGEEEWEMGHEAGGGAGASTAGVGGGLEVSPAGARGGGPGREEASDAVARFGRGVGWGKSERRRFGGRCGVGVVMVVVVRVFG